MFSKVINILKLAFSVAPKVLGDIDSARTKIKSQPILSQKILDFLDLGIEILEEVAPLI